MKLQSLKQPFIWVITLPLLVLANAAYLTHNVFGWSFTLGFFLVVPGYLVLRALGQEALKNGRFSLSIGLSLCLLTISGLALNTLHYLGLERPLETVPVFITLDILVLLLLIIKPSNRLAFHRPRLNLSFEGYLFALLFTALPVLSVLGAIRLNNGASNILTMIMMGMIGFLYLVLTFRTKLTKLYPYFIFTTALAILLCISLRGWYVTGHDIHHEYSVLHNVLTAGLWLPQTNGGDPYNACLSITILPAMLAKISAIVPVYIYKVIFQVLFAAIVPALYIFAKRFVTPQKALIGILAFMTFPTFTNDLPYLNRQEVAFAYFILILYINFSAMAYKIKSILTVVLLISIILSHYSTSYMTISILLLSYILFMILSRLFRSSNKLKIPMISLPIILMAFLGTFVWNAQITASSSNLSNTLSITIQGMLGVQPYASNFGHYSLLSRSAAKPPDEQFKDFADGKKSEARFASSAELPLTSSGRYLSKYVDVEKANVVVHAMIAKILQLLVLIGTIVLFFRVSKPKVSPKMVYFLCLSVSFIVALMIFTFLPQLSIGYDITRLFQQSLMVLWLPVVFAMEFVFAKFGRYVLLVSTALIVFLYFNLAGFLPQLIGGFLPQLALNNSGLYYDYFYEQHSDRLGTAWLGKNRIEYLTVYMDTTSSTPILTFSPAVGLITGDGRGYYYTDFANNNTGHYRTFLSSGFAEYTNPNYAGGKELIYSNGSSKIYFKLGNSSSY